MGFKNYKKIVPFWDLLKNLKQQGHNIMQQLRKYIYKYPKVCEIDLLPKSVTLKLHGGEKAMDLWKTRMHF